jgi:disulfide bond formation protein DsbB
MPLSTFIVDVTVISHFVFLVLVLAVIFYRSWGREVVKFFGKHAVVFSFLTALVAAIGSLTYSIVIGFDPCELCWWQRIFLFPQAVVFLTALLKKEENVFRFTVPLSIISAIISVYHAYIQLGGTHSVLPCTAAGAACSKVYVNSFGYITIPTMALTIALFLILFAVMHKLSKKI